MEKVSNVEKKRNLILNDNIWKTLLLISLPVAVSSMVTEIFALFDTYFSSTIGKIEMAATVFIGPINSFIAAVGMGFGVAATALIAREIALKNYGRGRSIFFQMLIVTILAAAVLLVLCLFFSVPILKAAGATGELLQSANIYFKIIVLALPFRFFNDIYMGQQRAIGNNKQIMVVNIASIIIKFIVSYVLIIVMKQGIVGLGISTLIATLFVSLVGIYTSLIKKTELRLGKIDFKISLNLIGIILLFSLPIIIEKSTQSFGNVIINSYATGLGENVLTAYGIINRINSVIFSFSSGFGAALVSIVSQNMAVKNILRIKEAKIKGIILSLAIVSVSLVLVLSLKTVIAGIYAKDDADLLKSIVTGINIYTISAIPWTIMHIYFGIFQGLKKTVYILIVSLARLWLFRVLLVGLLIKFTDMGEYAIWYGMLISNVLALVVTLIIYCLKTRKVLDYNYENNKNA